MKRAGSQNIFIGHFPLHQSSQIPESVLIIKYRMLDFNTKIWLPVWLCLLRLAHLWIFTPETEPMFPVQVCSFLWSPCCRNVVSYVTERSHLQYRLCALEGDVAPMTNNHKSRRVVSCDWTLLMTVEGPHKGSIVELDSPSKPLNNQHVSIETILNVWTQFQGLNVMTHSPVVIAMMSL